MMALNTWGMPASLGAYDKSLRMEAIGKLIQKKEYDVYLLEELWMRPDHRKIRGLIPSEYSMTTVDQLNNPHQMTACDGSIGPDGCSGLAIVSRHKFTQVDIIWFDFTFIFSFFIFLLIVYIFTSQVEFFPYSDHGDLWWKDGEYFARKVPNHF